MARRSLPKISASCNAGKSDAALSHSPCPPTEADHEDPSGSEWSIAGRFPAEMRGEKGAHVTQLTPGVRYLGNWLEYNEPAAKDAEAKTEKIAVSPPLHAERLRDVYRQPAKSRNRSITEACILEDSLPFRAIRKDPLLAQSQGINVSASKLCASGRSIPALAVPAYAPASTAR